MVTGEDKRYHKSTVICGQTNKKKSEGNVTVKQAMGVVIENTTSLRCSLDIFVSAFVQFTPLTKLGNVAFGCLRPKLTQVPLDISNTSVPKGGGTCMINDIQGYLVKYFILVLFQYHYDLIIVKLQNSLQNCLIKQHSHHSEVSEFFSFGFGTMRET